MCVWVCSSYPLGYSVETCVAVGVPPMHLTGEYKYAAQKVSAKVYELFFQRLDELSPIISAQFLF